VHDHESTHSTPRWVKMTGIIVIVLLLLFASLHLIGVGLFGHMPGVHGDHARLSGNTERGPQQP
jgi:hypothetical protein